MLLAGVKIAEKGRSFAALAAERDEKIVEVTRAVNNAGGVDSIVMNTTERLKTAR